MTPTAAVAPPAGSTRRQAAAPSARPRPSDAWWVEPTRVAALIVFPGLLVFSVLVPALAGRVFWTVAVASLPLVFVLAGYHRWRRICPLAFVSQIPTRLGWGGRRRAGPWLQAHAYRVAFSVFVVSLWLRLVATNGDGFALAAFVLALCASAIGIGLVFTGKTWCNYVCPVMIVEKLYTEPRGLRDTPNSQCATCTACRPACPDINEENSYWKEILTPAKRDVYFAFPGVVAAFYTYYYLQSGTWSYYFTGAWTHEVGLVRTAFLPGVDHATAGFFFAPAVPRALAAFVTLALGAAASVVGFRLFEPAVGHLLAARGGGKDATGLRSVMFTLAAFTAFVTFYTFAGAPTLRLVKGLPHSFQLLVVTTATICLVRRIGRSQEVFAEETLARKIIANWKWDDIPAPKDLREAFLIHTIKLKSNDEARRQVLDLYKTAVSDSLASGVVSRGEVHRLDALRSQLRISDTDHERVMAELADERGGLAAPAQQMSPEKQLQLDTYAEALAVHLERRNASGSDDAFVRELREQFGVTGEEHAAVLDRLLQSRDGVAHQFGDLPAAIEWSAAGIERLSSMRSSVARFIVRLLRRRWTRAADSLVHTLSGDDGPESVRDGLASDTRSSRDAAFANLAARVSTATAARLTDAVEEARTHVVEATDESTFLRLHLTSPDPYLRATAFYLLESLEAASDEDRERLAADEHPLVVETVAAAAAAARGEPLLESSTLEKMIGLTSIGVFADLEPEDLAQLARAGVETWYPRGEPLCTEGEVGDDVFVVLDGEVSVTRASAEGARIVAVEGSGSCIGELAVLDPAPREATVLASTVAVRTLRLSGAGFRQALGSSPAVSEAVIRILARRLRQASDS
jgi:hypothetical protein